MITVNILINILVLYLLIRLNLKIANIGQPLHAVRNPENKKRDKRLLLFSLEIAERYTVIKEDGDSFKFDTSQSPIYFMGGTSPSGWDTNTLKYIDENGTEVEVNTIHNGVWMQSDHQGKTSFPTICGYC